MKTTLAALVATVALIALYQGMQQDTGMAHADANNPNDYMLISGDVECRITQGVVREKIARLDLEPGCDASHPIAQAAMIEENDDGTIDLLGADGKAVIRFAAAEGDTHVSYEPQAPLVRLVALD